MAQAQTQAQATETETSEIMDDVEFLDFVNGTGASAHGACYNLRTHTCTKQARDILIGTPFKALARQGIPMGIVRAYTSMPRVRAKIDAIMAQYNITVIAPQAETDAQA